MGFFDKLSYWLAWGRWLSDAELARMSRDHNPLTGEGYDEPIGPGISTPMVGSSASDVQNGTQLPDYLDPDNSTKKDYNIWEYLEGLFSSQGAELESNRKFNSAEAALNRQFQADEAQKQRDWYTELSNSAYQRSVADMKSAGINPILAYSQGGAASATSGIPTGSAAAMSTGGGDSITSVLSSIADVISALKGGSGSDVSKLYSILKMVM